MLAPIGQVQLRRFPGELAPRRVALASLYRQLLAEVPGVRLLAADLQEIVNHIQPIRVLDGRRGGLWEFLRRQGIETGIHYLPNHLLSYLGGCASGYR